MEAMARIYGGGPTRVQLENKDPRGYGEFMSILAGNSAKGSALTMRGVQAHRPSLYDLEPQLKDLRVPTLLILGDEDEPCLDANVYMKRTIPSAGLVIIPQTGHACNIEEPEAFNAALRRIPPEGGAGALGRTGSEVGGRYDFDEPVIEALPRGKQERHHDARNSQAEPAVRRGGAQRRYCRRG